MSVLQTLARRRVALGFVTGLATLILAHPSWASWRAGLVVAIAGESLRFWAAGHLEKSREVTRSGPYRWMRHPLYAGSTIMALGVVIASRSAIVGVLALLYMAATITAAIKTEEAFLRAAFGDAYDRYAGAHRDAADASAEPIRRRFSVARAVRNREYRAAAGLLAGFALLALKARASL
jgi:protein-S-isoprenylcysteine O-methyltransferase Ste14